MTTPDSPETPEPGREPEGGDAPQRPQSPLEAMRARRAAAGDPPPPAGAFRVQTPDTAVRREPTLAERRERDRVRREAEEHARREAEERELAEHKKRRKRTYLISGGVALGLVGVLAAAYMAGVGDGPDYEQAQCVDENGIVTDDSYCADQGNAQAGPNGMLFFLVGGMSYRYSYGSNAPIGSPANGSSTPSAGTQYATGSGREVTSRGGTGGPVNRGGLGSTSGGNKGSSNRGGSSGS